MDIRQIHADLIPIIQDDLAVLGMAYPVDEVGYIYERLSELFQALSICHLLEGLDTESFRENLVRSGFARQFFLRKSFESGNTKDRRLAISRTEAFLDALVSGYTPLWAGIDRFQPKKWHPDWEYEDDFAYFLFLHVLSVRSSEASASPNLKPVLDRFEVSLEGEKTPRFQICQSLLDKDPSGFQDALHQLMDEIEEKYEAKKARLLEPDPSQLVLWARSFVSIEGLALLRMAELMGMEVEEAFALCPPSARLSQAAKPFVDVFTELDAVLD